MWDLQHVAKKALSKHISQCRLKVVLNGDGSNEMFGGYPFFVADRLAADDKHRSTKLQEIDPSHREALRKQFAENTEWFGMEDSDERATTEASKALDLPPAFSHLARIET